MIKKYTTQVMICQKRPNYSEPPVDTACGNVEFCHALPEGSGFVLLRRDKVYLSIRLRIKLRRTSRVQGCEPGSRLPAMCHRTLLAHKFIFRMLRFRQLWCSCRCF